MRIVGWSRSLTLERAAALGIERADTPEEAVAAADAVSVHLPFTHETRGRVGASVLEAMAAGAHFINTHRAELLNHVALRKASADKGIRAGLDVFSDEPAAKEGPFEIPIASRPSVYGTHPIGASTMPGEEAVGDEVNLAQRTAATHMTVVRYADCATGLNGLPLPSRL